MAEDPRWTLRDYQVYESKNVTNTRWEQACALELYPHVIDKLVILWGYPEVKTYLEDLLIIKRPHRRGFSNGANTELMFLYSMCKDEKPKDPWGHNPR